MRAARTKRGATAIGREDAVPALPRYHLLVGAAIAATIMAFVLIPSGGENQAGPSTSLNSPAQVQAEPQPDTLPASEPADPEPVEPPWVEVEVRPGDNLSLIFKRAGFNDRDVHDVVAGAPHGKALAHIFPGQVIAFQADEKGGLAAVHHVRSPFETAVYWRGETGFDSRIDTRSPEVQQSWASGEITSSLFMAGQEAGLSQNLIMELANIFGGVIDFVLDPREGDTIHLLYEELYIDGEKLGDGDILAASFTNQGKTYSAYHYTDSNGDPGYYNEEGVSMRKSFLLAPVDFTRISSNFNLRRLHPIYKTKRPHRGTDYAAPTGTPVYAAGDGRVIRSGYTRANGNYVFIQHGEQFVTHYLHLNKRRVKTGQRVSQGQVIGTVGSTGAATGPHLHYEFLVNGVHRNPRTIHKSLPRAKSLPSSELPLFRESIAGLSLQLAALNQDSQLAMNHLADTTAH